MATEFTGRSVQQQIEDELIELHTYLDRQLNGTIPDRSDFPSGSKRRVAFKWFRTIDAAITHPDGFASIRVPYDLNPAWYIRNTILRS